MCIRDSHIPTVDIRQLGDISFDRQLALAQQPNRDYDVDQWLFVPNTYTCLLYTSLLGHTSIKTTMDRYVHVTAESLDYAIKQFQQNGVV